jgi:predicted MFS family arabinose efflux permease
MQSHQEKQSWHRNDIRCPWERCSPSRHELASENSIQRPARRHQFRARRREGAFGPYIGIFLLTHEGWNPAAIGGLKTFSGLVALAFNSPIGAFIDATRCKRGAITAAALVLALGAIAVALAPTMFMVIAATAAMAIAGDIFGPAVAAMTLGLLSASLFSRRIGRNSAFDHAGNVTIAILAGAVGWWLGQHAVFFLVPLFAVIVGAAVLSIPPRAIDHRAGARWTRAR